MSQNADAHPLADEELLGVAREILLAQGYAVEQMSTSLEMLLAENAYFLVGVVATPTTADLIAVEGIAEAVLADRLAASDAGPKKWDVYLVLITQERPYENEVLTRGLYDINYDTARLRRIARAGVQPTLAAVGKALAPFLTPPELDDASVAADPFKMFVEALAARGVDSDLAQRAVSAFEMGANLADVL